MQEAGIKDFKLHVGGWLEVQVVLGLNDRIETLCLILLISVMI